MMTDWNLYEDCKKRIISQLQKNNVHVEQHNHPIMETVEKCEMQNDVETVEVDEDCIYNDLIATANVTYRVREEHKEETQKVTLADMKTLITDNKNYLIEVNKNGCSRYCVCGYCKTDEIPLLEDNTDTVCGVQKLKWMFLTEGVLSSIQKKMESLSLVESHAKENITETPTFELENDTNKNETCEGPKVSYNLNPLKYKPLGDVDDIPNDETRLLYKSTMDEFRACNTFMDAWRSLSYDDDDRFGLLITSVTPQQLKREVADILDTDILAKILWIICGKFSFCNDWKLMYKYLITVAFIPRFTEVYVLLRNTEVYQLLKCTLNNAVMYNLENAKIIKEVFIKESM